MAARSFTEPYIVTAEGWEQIQAALNTPSPLAQRDLPEVEVFTAKEIADEIKKQNDDKITV